jgi:hypothetical protein
MRPKWQPACSQSQSMASAALSRPQTTVLPVPDSQAGNELRADELCDQLLAHMLDCELCLDPERPTCAICSGLQNEIKAQGGPAKGIVFAI